jgi:hypothetical protein
MVSERRNLSRRIFSYYMRVFDEVTGEVIGHLADISTSGFKIDSKKPIPPNAQFVLRIENTGQLGEKDFVTFAACSRWCNRDEYHTSMYNAGFQLTNIEENDYHIFLKMFDEYGVQKAGYS